MADITDSGLSEALSMCRQDIDRIDAVLVALLGERTRLALKAGEMKLAAGQPVHVAAREAVVLQRVCALAIPPLEQAAVARIFQSIIDETRAAEQLLVESGYGD